MTATVLSHTGNSELLRFSQQRFTMVGLLSAIIIHILIIAVVLLVNAPQGDGVSSVIKNRKIRLIHLPPPPMNEEIAVRAVVGYAAAAIHTAQGIPVPVPDPEVSKDALPFADQTEIAFPSTGQHGNGVGNCTYSDEYMKLPGMITESIDEIEPDTFKAIEIMPVAVKAVLPEYPAAARLSHTEGTVWVRCYVDKTGKVRNTTILKSDSEIFNDSALQAAGQFLFTPAIMNAGAVSVWVSIPFRFRLSR